MVTPKLEQRIAALEKELAQLRSKLEASDSGSSWLDRVVGAFKDSPAHAEAMRLGRKYRESLRPKSPKRKGNGKH